MLWARHKGWAAALSVLWHPSGRVGMVLSEVPPQIYTALGHACHVQLRLNDSFAYFTTEALEVEDLRDLLSAIRQESPPVLANVRSKSLSRKYALVATSESGDYVVDFKVMEQLPHFSVMDLLENIPKQEELTMDTMD